MTAPDSRFKLPLTFMAPSGLPGASCPLGVTVTLLR